MSSSQNRASKTATMESREDLKSDDTEDKIEQ